MSFTPCFEEIVELTGHWQANIGSPLSLRVSPNWIRKTKRMSVDTLFTQDGLSFVNNDTVSPKRHTSPFLCALIPPSLGN